MSDTKTDTVSRALRDDLEHFFLFGPGAGQLYGLANQKLALSEAKDNLVNWLADSLLSKGYAKEASS